METKQISELAELTSLAVSKNDIESLVKIYTFLQNQLKEDRNAFGVLGIEWFGSSLTIEQFADVVYRYENKNS
jgi:hypothetical protein